MEIEFLNIIKDTKNFSEKRVTDEIIKSELRKKYLLINKI